MDDDESKILGSRKPTCPSDVSFQEWTQILDHCDDSAPASKKGGGIFDGKDGSTSSDSNDRLAGWREGKSEFRAHHYTRFQQKSVPRVPSPHEVNVANSVASAGTDHGHLCGRDDFEPSLTTGVSPRILGDMAGSFTHRSFLHEDDLNAMRSTPGKSSGYEKHHSVIITTESAEEGPLAYPTPLGFTRRASLYERANSTVNVRSEGRRVIASSDEVDEFDVPDSLRVQDIEVDSESIVESEKPQRTSLGTGNNTVLRDWLMHVLEKDDQHDAKAREVADNRPAYEMTQSTGAGTRRQIESTTWKHFSTSLP